MRRKGFRIVQLFWFYLITILLLLMLISLIGFEKGRLSISLQIKDDRE